VGGGVAARELVVDERRALSHRDGQWVVHPAFANDLRLLADAADELIVLLVALAAGVGADERGGVDRFVAVEPDDRPARSAAADSASAVLPQPVGPIR